MALINWLLGMFSPERRELEETKRKMRKELDGLLSRGFVEKMLIVPANMGGPDVRRNWIYLPPEPAARKREFDAKFYARVAGGETLQYKCTPEYDSDSFVPARLPLEASTTDGKVVFHEVIDVAPHRIWDQKIAYPPKLASQIETAMERLRLLMASQDGLWQISQTAWSVDQDAGTVTFHSPRGLTAVAPVQIIGSYNTDDLTWLWSWQNPSIEAALAKDARKLRSSGEKRGYDVLTKSKFVCSETQCWELTALACMLADAQGAYCGPAGVTRVFMTFGEVKLGKTVRA